MDVATTFIYTKVEEETYVDNLEGLVPVGGINRV